MDKSIGDLIRECRKAANLTQKQLGALIYHTDGSMISRFERGIALPSATTLNAIVDALSGRDGVPQEALQELIDFNRSRDPVDFVSDQSILLLLRKLDRFNPENRELVVDDLRRSIEINWSFFYAERIGRRRDWEQAAKELSALREMVGRHNERIYSRIDEALARCLYCDGSMLEAVRSYKRALASAEHFNDRYLQARIHLKLGDVYRRSGGAGFEQANEAYEEAQKLFAEHRRDEAGGQLDDRNWEAISLRKQAGSLLFAGRPDKAEAMIRTSLKLSEDSQYNEGIYKAKQHLAWVSCMTGRWEDAVTLSEEALDLIPDENTWVKTKGWRYLGDAHRLARHLEKAKEAYETALDLFRAVEVGPSSTYALIMLGLAKLYLKQNLFTEARRHLEEGYKIHKRRSEDIRTVDFLAEYGKLFMRLGRYDEAEIRLREARDWFKELGNEFQYVHTLAMLCELYFEMDKWKEIFRARDEALAIDPSLVKYHLAEIQLQVGKAQAGSGQTEAAAESWFLATEAALAFNDICFEEVSAKVALEMETMAHQDSAAANQLCEAFVAHWKETPELRPVAQEMLDSLQKRVNDARLVGTVVEG